MCKDWYKTTICKKRRLIKWNFRRRNFAGNFEISFNIRPIHNTASSSRIPMQKKLRFSSFKQQSSSTCCQWSSSNTAALLVLKLAVWVVRVTNQTCTQRRGRQRKWREMKTQKLTVRQGAWCAVFAHLKVPHYTFFH